MKSTAAKSAGKSTRRQTLTDLRRGEIIAAALKVFARHGFHAARAEDVAAQAGIAKGTLYLYFDSKEAIYEAALKHAMTALGAIVAERIATATTVRDRIAAWIGARLEFWMTQGGLYRMILTVRREKKYRRQTAAILQSSVAGLNEMLGAAMKHGELPVKPAAAIGWIVMDAIRGAIERRIDGASEWSVAEDTEVITEVVMRYFEVSPAGSRIRKQK